MEVDMRHMEVPPDSMAQAIESGSETKRSFVLRHLTISGIKLSEYQCTAWWVSGALSSFTPRIDSSSWET